MAAKKKNSNPLSKKTEWSITEFQMWLAGAYSLQGEDWVPNAEQWEMIVDIIYKLKNPVQKKAVAPVGPVLPPPGYGGVPDGGFGGNSMAAPMPTGGSALDAAPLPDEANLSLSELKRRREGGPSNGNVLVGGGAPGEKTIKTGAFE